LLAALIHPHQTFAATSRTRGPDAPARVIIFA